MSEEITNLQPVAPMGGAPGTITLRLPKINWQIAALILIAVIAGFQTFQLTKLRGATAARSATAATSPAAASSQAAPAPAGNSHGLQGMVGGC